MGYVTAFGVCCVCGNVFSFNPHLVPSVRINNVREPMCKQCIDEANHARLIRKEQPIEVRNGAYEPMDETEL